MAGYVATPQVQRSDEIILGTQSDGSTAARYRIRGRVQVSLATQQPPKVVIGDYGKDDNPRLSVYSVSDWRAGMGLWRYRTNAQGTIAPEDQLRYWSGENIDGFYPKALTLGPLATSIGAGQNTGPYALNVIGSSIIGVFTLKSYTYTSGTTWSLSTHTFGNTPSDSVAFNGRIFYALGASGVAYQSDATTFVETVAGASDPAAMYFTIWDNKIFAMDTTGFLWWSLTGNAASWTKSIVALPVAVKDYLELVTYYDSSGDPIIYALTTAGVYSYDFVNDKWYPTAFLTPFNNRLSDVRSNGTVYRGAIYYHARDMRVYRMAHDTLRFLNVEDVSIDQPDGVMVASPDFRGEIWSMVADNDRLYAGIGANKIGVGPYLAVFGFNGVGWHPIWSGGTALGTALGTRVLQILDTTVTGTSAYRLYFNQLVGSTNSLQWIDLLGLAENPLVSTRRTYAASGYVEMPWYAAGYEAQSKTAIQFRIKVTGLATANETVQVAYGVDGSTTYTNLGSAITSATTGISGGAGEITLKFGANNVGLNFKSIRFKLTLASGGSTNAPKIEYFALDFRRKPDILRGFVVNIDCSQDSPDGRSPVTQIADLWNTIGLATLNTFAYRDGNDATGATRAFLVEATDPLGSEGTGPDEAGVYRLMLPSYGANAT